MLIRKKPLGRIKMEKFDRVKCRNLISRKAVPFEVKTALNILYRRDNRKLQNTRNIPIKIIDDFLFSGKFNSVLGPEGFNHFKTCLKDITKDINSNNFSANIINLDKMFETLLDSGLYYNEEFLPPDFKNANEDVRWLTAYRYIAKNFPEINYKDFRTIIKRFQETRGYSFYIEQNDSKYLLNILNKKELFIEIVDLKAELLQLNQTELKSICNYLQVQPARSLNDTADRIVELDENLVRKYLPQKTKTRTNLVIKDDELATGNDLINLDKYLRELAKIIRSDFADFILSKRYISFLGEL